MQTPHGRSADHFASLLKGDQLPKGGPLEAEPVISLTSLRPGYPWHLDRCLCRDSAPPTVKHLWLSTHTH